MRDIKWIAAGMAIAVVMFGCAGRDLKAGDPGFMKVRVANRTLAFTPPQGLEVEDSALFAASLRRYGVSYDSAGPFLTEVFVRAFRHYVEVGTFRYDSLGAGFSDTTFGFQYDSLVRRTVPDSRNPNRDTTLIITIPVDYRIREPKVTADSAAPDYSITVSRAVFSPRPYAHQSFVYGASTGGGCTGTEIAAGVDYMIWDHRAGKPAAYGRIESGSEQCGDVTADSWLLAVDATVKKIVKASPFRGGKVYVRHMAQSERSAYLFSFMKQKRLQATANGVSGR